MVARNGSASRPVLSQRYSANATSAVAAGTHHKNRIFGNENHRSAMRSNASGVHKLTMAMQASTRSNSTLALLSGCRPVISERLRLTKSSVAAYLWRAREAGLSKHPLIADIYPAAQVRVPLVAGSVVYAAA